MQRQHIYDPVLYTYFMLNHLTAFSISTIDMERIISRFYHIIQMIATHIAIHLVRCCHGQMSLIAVSYPIIFIHDMALQPISSPGLPNLPPPDFSIHRPELPVSNKEHIFHVPSARFFSFSLCRLRLISIRGLVWGFETMSFFYGMRLSALCPTWRTRVSFLVWFFT